MPSLKEVRSRITSTISTQQITSAMKMVSASKLRRAQDAIVQMRPFSQKLKEILDNLILSAGSSVGVFGKVRNPDKVAVIVITSNRGLCGGFNANVIKATNLLVREKYAEQAKKGNVGFITIGKKATDFYRKSGAKVISSHNEAWDHLTYDNAAAIMDGVMKQYISGEIDSVEVVYNQFKNAATQILKVEQVLPFTAAPVKPSAEVQDTKKEGKGKGKPDYIFEPDKEEIIQELIPYAIKVRLFSSLLDSFAAE
ncbi:MAG TPA: ATP synthase F1 subunit gamma, partial [Bacteroidia bacterium]|nr:ATP synthase F1 subunit gamma [Bacteroidia bacterium]